MANNNTPGFPPDKIEILRVIAHPQRLRILAELTKGVRCVSDFEDALELPQPVVSHHLGILRRHDLVDFFVDGRLKCYFLRNPMVPEIIEALRKEYAEELPLPQCCPITKKGKYPGDRPARTKRNAERRGNRGDEGQRHAASDVGS